MAFINGNEVLFSAIVNKTEVVEGEKVYRHEVRIDTPNDESTVMHCTFVIYTRSATPLTKTYPEGVGIDELTPFIGYVYDGYVGSWQAELGSGVVNGVLKRVTNEQGEDGLVVENQSIAAWVEGACATYYLENDTVIGTVIGTIEETVFTDTVTEF
jgi:hypothetical protein